MNGRDNQRGWTVAPPAAAPAQAKQRRQGCRAGCDEAADWRQTRRKKRRQGASEEAGHGHEEDDCPQAVCRREAGAERGDAQE